MIRRLSAFSLTIVAMVLGISLVCQAQQPLLTRHVREVVANGQVQFLGRLPATQSMNFDIVLSLRHQAELENFLQHVYDPTSSEYRHFVSVKEFTERFGPSQEDYDALLQFAKASGFTVKGGSRDSMDVQFSGTVAAIEKAFHVTMGVYRHPTENRTFYGPDREPTVDLPFQLWHISGLDNFSIPRPLMKHKNLGVKGNAVEGSCPGSSYCGSDMRAAYYGETTLTGAGQSLGLLEYLGYDIADLNTYFSNVGQTNTVSVVGISTDGSSLSCLHAKGCDDREQILDMTQSISMAPGMTTLYVYVGNTDTALLSGMSSDTPLPAQLSSSWTWSPADPSTDDPYFEKMVSQGQSYFQAAGDSGAWAPRNGSPWPADSDYVITVGGTDLETSGAGGPWSSEVAWVDGGGGYFSGDGIPIPSWQQLAGVINSENQGSTTLRNGPDVSAEANFDFYTCADQEACQTGWGGTSFAAPMWAGYTALINQQAVANGNPVVGFINPAIYPLGLSSGYGAAFHDITSGNNDCCGQARFWTAVTGYDLVTGWGSPNGSGLINALAGSGTVSPSFTLTANPTSVTITQGSSGTSTITVVPAGGFTGSVSLSASGLPSGVTAGFSPTSTTTTSTLTLTASATAATGTSTVTITGTSGSLTSTTSVQLTVNTSSGTPAVTLSPTSLAWGNVVVGQTSASKTVTLTNSGTATLNISKIAATGDFSVAANTAKNACGSTVAAGASCTVKVTLTPTQVGSRTGSLQFTDNAAGSPQSVALSGTGAPQATLTPASATFHTEPVGTASPAKTFTLTNKQNVALTSISITTTGDFSISTMTCGSSLAATSSCTVTLVFTPSQMGTRTGTLQASDSAVGSPQVSNLTGTGK